MATPLSFNAAHEESLQYSYGDIRTLSDEFVATVLYFMILYLL